MSDRDDLTDLHGDRISLANAIQNADIERAQLAAAIFDRIRDNVATKADLSLLHAEIVGIRSATTGVQAEIDLLARKADVRGVSVEAARVRDEVTALRGVVQAMERHLNARIERVEHRLLTRLGGLVVVDDRDHPGCAALPAAGARLTCQVVCSPTQATGASLAPPPANEQAEIETMLKRLEELRRAASNNELFAAYQAAIDGLDGVLYRLAMLRPPPKRTPLSAAVSSPPPAPKAATPTRAAAARIVVARKPRRR